MRISQLDRISSRDESLRSNKLFFAKSKYCPKNWQYDHVGFVLNNGQLLQASGHRIGDGVYTMNGLKDDKVFDSQNIKTVRLPKTIAIDKDIDFVNCTTFVANNLKENNIDISNEKLIDMFKN